MNSEWLQCEESETISEQYLTALLWRCSRLGEHVVY